MLAVADGVMASTTGALLLTSCCIFMMGMAVEAKTLKKFMMTRISSCEALASAAPEEKAVAVEAVDSGSVTQSFDWAALEFYRKNCEEWAMCMRTTGEIIVDKKQAELLEAVSDALRTQYRRKARIGCLYDLRQVYLPPISESYLRCRKLSSWCGAQTIKEDEEGGGHDTRRRRSGGSAAAKQRSLIEATVHSVAIVLPPNRLVASVVSFFLWIGRGSMETRIFEGDRGALAANAFLLEREAIYRTKVAGATVEAKVKEEAMVDGNALPIKKAAAARGPGGGASSSFALASRNSMSPTAEIEAQARSLPSFMYS